MAYGVRVRTPKRAKLPVRFINIPFPMEFHPECMSIVTSSSVPWGKTNLSHHSLNLGSSRSLFTGLHCVAPTRLTLGISSQGSRHGEQEILREVGCILACQECGEWSRTRDCGTHFSRGIILV